MIAVKSAARSDRRPHLLLRLQAAIDQIHHAVLRGSPGAHASPLRVVFLAQESATNVREIQLEKQSRDPESIIAPRADNPTYIDPPQTRRRMPSAPHAAVACGILSSRNCRQSQGKPEPHRPHSFPATRFRPRRLPFPAGSVAGSFVALRLATRDTEASARSNTSMISARFRSRSCHISSASCTTSSAPRNRPLSTACRTNASCSGLNRTSMPLSLKVTTAPVKHLLSPYAFATEALTVLAQSRSTFFFLFRLGRSAHREPLFDRARSPHLRRANQFAPLLSSSLRARTTSSCSNIPRSYFACAIEAFPLSKLPHPAVRRCPKGKGSRSARL
jgi:hypothetical protein